GAHTLRPGDTLEMRVAPGQRTAQVMEIISVDSSTAVPPRPPRESFSRGSDRQRVEASVQEMGTVKCFGFIVLDGGGRDVIVHVEIVTDQLDRTVQFYTEVLG